MQAQQTNRRHTDISMKTVEAHRSSHGEMKARTLADLVKVHLALENSDLASRTQGRF